MKKIHVIADNADDVLSLNVMCFDNHFLVKGEGIEVECEEIVEVHCFRKGINEDMRSEENYLVP